MTPGAEADRRLLDHMLECVDRILEYTGESRDRFIGSRLVQDAVVRNLQVMAESSQRLSAQAKADEPGIPWLKIAGIRNILVHQYLAIDVETVWIVIERDLRPLHEALVRMKARLPTGDMPSD